MNRTQSILSSVALTSLLAISPFIASAQGIDANDSARISINPDGIVRVMGADVTAVSGSVINAASTFGTMIMNWIVTLSASTHTSGNGWNGSTTSAIKAGDKINFSGVLSGNTGSSLAVLATQVRDTTAVPKSHRTNGTIVSISTANNSFVIRNGTHTFTVQDNASTTITSLGSATTSASLMVGGRVRVLGMWNTEKSLITASQINFILVKHDTDKKDDKKDESNGDTHSENKHASSTSDRIHDRLNVSARLHLGENR